MVHYEIIALNWKLIFINYIRIFNISSRNCVFHYCVVCKGTHYSAFLFKCPFDLIKHKNRYSPLDSATICWLDIYLITFNPLIRMQCKKKIILPFPNLTLKVCVLKKKIIAPVTIKLMNKNYSWKVLRSYNRACQVKQHYENATLF